jgi:hypothetical protein
MRSSKRWLRFSLLSVFLLGVALRSPSYAQLVLGGITGTVKDSSGGSVSDVTVKAKNTGTNLEVTTKTKGSGEYTLPNLPIGQYAVSFSKTGFETEDHGSIQVDGDRITTVDGNLRVGAVTATVEVSGTPLMNQVDTTNGYVVDQLTIEDTPLGTGSFTQLAILAPGVNADFLSGAGSNAGLGNQAIFANGQRDTSNSFALNGINTNNLFNGKTTSSLGEGRFISNTGESFGAGGSITTTTSVYSAIGQALPSPAPETIEQISVNAAMYDATQGANSGAHIGVITKSGTNKLHAELYEHFQNSDMNAAPFFYNAAPSILVKRPFLARNAYGATVGGPIKKDKLFFFGAYQGVNIADAQSGSVKATVPITLTNDRSVTGILNTYTSDFNKTIAASQISPVSLALLQATTTGGGYLIPTPTVTNLPTASFLGYDALVQGPNVQARVHQGSGNIDYLISDRDRLAAKYYFQSDPTSSPFSSGVDALGFPQKLDSGAQVVSLDNTFIISPTMTWQQRIGFTREKAYAGTTDSFTPTQFGITLPNNSSFPEIYFAHADNTISGSYYLGPNPSFGNAGMFQNQMEYASSVSWVKGRHTITFGGSLDHTQLNIVNNNTASSALYFSSFVNFLEGNVSASTKAVSFIGAASRYYRADTAGTYINDTYKLKSNITVTAGLRWDFDGPLSEKYGRLTTFDPADYAYSASTDTITSSGLLVASNNAALGTPGAGDTLMKAHQYGIAPRIGVAWSPMSKLTVRAGYGIYYDRGELFSYFNAGAGGGFSGPFGVTLSPPFVSEVEGSSASTFANPFPTAGAVVPSTPAALLAQLPNLAQTSTNKFPAGNLYGPFVYSGYDENNHLPYTQNWTVDLQYQASPNLLVTVGYVGNHGTNEVLPIPFNQPQIATPSNPINGQIYSYGFTYPNGNLLEPISANLNGESDAGNAGIRVPYLGYNANSVQYEAEGISNYNALQVSIKKKLSFGLQLTATYTWSHDLDEQSGLGLFYTGNNPLQPSTGYASSDFDRTHVFLVNYSYRVPKLTTNKGLGTLINGWIIGGQTVAESGQPFSVYDYSGSVASLYYSSDAEIVNPIVPLAPGTTAKQAQLQSTTGVNPSTPYLNASAFQPQFLQPGQDGVPPCDSTGKCDTGESLFSVDGRNLWRGPFGVRFDMTLGKQFDLSERFKLRFNANAYNVFNHPDFDAPYNEVSFFDFNPPVVAPSASFARITDTLGSSRFLELNLHLTF